MHILGYWIDGASPELPRLLERLRRARAERAYEIAQRLAAAGAPIDVSEQVAGTAAMGRSIARPEIARALIQAGHVTTVAEAFDRYLGEGRPGYVGHRGPTPPEVIVAIVGAGGVASLAHPDPLNRDEQIPSLVGAGRGAVEAYHSAHDDQTCSRYLAVAATRGLVVTGGSDFHGPTVRRSEFLGVAGLPAAEFSRLLERAGRTGRDVGI